MGKQIPQTESRQATAATFRWDYSPEFLKYVTQNVQFSIKKCKPWNETKSTPLHKSNEKETASEGSLILDLHIEFPEVVYICSKN